MGDTSTFCGLKTLALLDDGIDRVAVLAYEKVECIICNAFQYVSYFFGFFHTVVRFSAKGKHVLYVSHVGL